MPRRNKLRAAKRKPLRHRSGIRPKFEINPPSTTATTSGESTIGVAVLTTASTAKATAATTATSPSPGMSCLRIMALRG